MIQICTFRTAANTITTTTTCPVSIGAVFLPLLPWRRVTQDRGSRSLSIMIDPFPLKSERIYPMLVNYIHLFSAAISFIQQHLSEAPGNSGKVPRSSDHT